MEKPKKPRKPKDSKKCPYCSLGKRKLPHGPYDYEIISCGVCCGTGILTPNKQLEMLKEAYEYDMKKYNNYLILKDVKISKIQIEAMLDYGVQNFIKDFLQ